MEMVRETIRLFINTVVANKLYLDVAVGVTVAEALKDVALVVMVVAGGAGLYSRRATRN